MKVDKKYFALWGGGRDLGRQKGFGRLILLVEKPKPENAPSNLAIVGRYIITPEVFWHLERSKSSKDGEIRLIDGLQSFLKSTPFTPVSLKVGALTAETSWNFLKATVHYGLKHKEFNNGFAKYLKKSYDFKNKETYCVGDCFFAVLILAGAGCAKSKPVKPAPISLQWWGVWNESDQVAPLIAAYQASHQYVNISYKNSVLKNLKTN